MHTVGGGVNGERVGDAVVPSSGSSTIAGLQHRGQSSTIICAKSQASMLSNELFSR